MGIIGKELYNLFSLLRFPNYVRINVLNWFGCPHNNIKT